MLNKNLPITIAAGHKGNIGARGCGYKEEELTVELVNLIVRRFKALGYNITDVSPQGNYTANGQLVAEYTAANKITNAQLHLCIHFNASNGQGHGTETWIYAIGNKANPYATAINNAICGALGTANRGVKASGNSLAIPRRVNAPVCLLETVFIDNQSDMNKYVANKEKVADAIVKALTGEKVSTATSTTVSTSSTPTTSATTDSVYEKAKSYNKARCLELQQKLNKAYGFGLAEDNAYGQATHKALGEAQAKLGLTVDYLAGSKTFSGLESVIQSKSNYKVKITASTLNVRSGAGTNYGVTTTVKKNEVYTIVEEKNGWGRLKSNVGWICLSYTTKC